MAEETTTISFRVPAGIARQLDEAGSPQGLSKNEHARELLLAALTQPTNGELLAELQTLRTLLVRLLKFIEETTRHDARPEFRRVGSELHDLKEGLATSTRCLLVKAAGVAPDEAEEWVRSQMFSPPSH